MRPPQRWIEVAVLSLVVMCLCLSKPADKRSILLPPSLMPEYYRISLIPRIDQEVFHGVVEVTGLGLVETDKIVLHCKSLTFNTTSLTDMTTDEEIRVEDIKEDLLLQQCLLFLSQSLRRDHEYNLKIQFIGKIGKEVGLYKDFYMEAAVRHDILMTHFQPNFARLMFPCWDEPHYKAQFVIRVSAPPQFPTLISNMPIASVSPPIPEEDHRRWVEFEETLPMSTYLLVLVLCDYLALTDSTTNISVWAPRSRLHEAQLALNVSVAVLDQCERYFGSEYPLPKLDHVPVNFLNNVAMENWGAITYQNDFLLWEEGVSTWAQREMISHVISHEIVHQWLGDLVTTVWWNTTWLNEGVTSFYHYYIMDKIEPSWNTMDTLLVMQIQMIFNLEARGDTSPLTNNEAFTPEGISTVAFSASTYLKGASVIRMVFNLMSPDIFREAIVQYIIDNEYRSVDEEDLWQTIAAVADLPEDLEEVMYSWTHQPGFPLITVIRQADGCISIRQEKYLSKDESDIRWTIPVTYTTSSELDFNFSRTVWFLENQTEMALPDRLEDPTDWIIINIRQTGFYRVNYDLMTWRALTHDLQNCDLSDIHPVNRGQLLNDGFDLARHGIIDFSIILELSRYLRRETEYLPWSVAINWFKWLRERLLHTNIFPAFQQYTLGLVEEVFSRMPFRGDVGGMLPELHRKQVVEFACVMRHPRCVKETTDIAYLLLSGINIRIPVDLKSILLCSAVRNGQDEVWNFVRKEYLGAAENERWKYLVALACTSRPENIKRLLQDVVDPKSFLKSSVDRLDLLLEVGRQDNTLGPILDMILSCLKFDDLAANLDLDMVLRPLKLSLTPLLSVEDKKKIFAIAALVDKMQTPEHKDTMESIITEINRPDFQFLHEEPVTKWFARELHEEDQSLSTPRPSSVTKHILTSNSEMEVKEVKTTQRGTTTNVPTKTHEEEKIDSIQKENAEVYFGKDRRKDSEETTGTAAPTIHDNGGGISSVKVDVNVLIIVLLFFISAMR